MKGIKNENNGKKSLHGIRRNGKTPFQWSLGVAIERARELIHYYFIYYSVLSD